MSEELLEILKRVENNLEHHYPENLRDFEILKQAVIKSQEPKKYLKWEDLETGISYYGMLNGVKIQINLFPPHCTDDHKWEVRLIKDNDYWIHINEQDKDFFNDLHLERIEENE
jgi:hypothetical protein